MKIIISPSKTYSLISKFNCPGQQPKYIKKTIEILAELKKLSKADLQKIMKIKENLLEQTISNIDQYEQLESNHAIAYYTGFVYKGLHLTTYTKEMIDYLKNNLQILSAFYGSLSPFDLVRPYRLDMTMKLPNISLSTHWSDLLSKELEKEQIINLASTEFSQLIKLPMITIVFLENKNGVYKNISTYSKQARGYLLDYMIKHQINNPDKIKHFNLSGYSYNDSMSDGSKFVFTRG